MYNSTVSDIAQQMGVAEDLNWGNKRQELEIKLAGTAYKLMGLAIGLLIAFLAISFLMPEGAGRFVALFVWAVAMGITVEQSLRFKKQSLAERAASNKELGGRMPFCVAVLTVRTVPNRLIAFLRFGQPANRHEYRITTAQGIAGALSTYVSHNPSRYLLVGVFERGRLATVQDLENLLRSTLILYFARKVGGNLLLPPPPLLDELREIERKSTVPGSMR
ncbi:MAG: hypothetical protein AAB486_02665 [Patescibacteria group bacterium]